MLYLMRILDVFLSVYRDSLLMQAMTLRRTFVTIERARDRTLYGAVLRVLHPQSERTASPALRVASHDMLSGGYRA
jgi:hypothetical protein